VTGFSADWLELREPFDAAARSRALVVELCAHLRRGTADAPLAVLDLGAGAGSNLRYLAPLIGGAQHWRLADHEPRLLEAAVATTHIWADERGARVKRRGSTLSIDAVDFTCEIVCEPVDLAELTVVETPARGLVTAAALLDLVSREWLGELARRCRAANAAVCFALSYDGRTTAAPADSGDTEVLELFNRHQLGDKGFGPALGPAAAAAAVATFEAQDYEARSAPSDWVLAGQEHALQLALLDGWRDAAGEVAPERRAALEAWNERRRGHVLAGRSSVRVGHLDVVGWV
jgi:hypothetical protein